VNRDKKSISKKYSLLPVTCYLLYVLLSCKSVPPVQYEVPPQVLPLDEGASVYITAHVKEASPIISLIPLEALESNEVKMLMDRTDYLCAALFPRDSGKTMQIAAYGNYPSARVKMALGVNKNWKKMKSGWYSDMQQMSVYVTAKQAFASAWESAPDNPVSSSIIEFPEGFDNWNAPMSCWINDSGKTISYFLEKSGIPFKLPVENIFAAFYTEDDMFRVSIKLQFANASRARAVIGIINMIRLFADQENGGDDAVLLPLKLLTAEAPVLNGNYVNINPPPLNENNMRLFFNFLFAVF
jgi:hypothetical protein